MPEPLQERIRTEAERSEETIEPIVAYKEIIKSPEGEEIEADVAWEKISNQYGDVEISTFRGSQPSEKAVFYSMGLGGSIDRFKRKFVIDLINEGYDIVFIHRNGTQLGENSKSVDSPQRIEIAQQNSQSHIGDKPEYGYKEWTQEFSTAVSSLGERYNEIKFVGSSFGALVGLEGLRQLQEKKDTVVSKIKTFISLSGQIGKPIADTEGRVWVDKGRKYALTSGDDAKTSFDGILDYIRKSGGGGSAKMKATPEIIKEYLEIMDRLYDPATDLPKNVDVVHVMPWKEQFFATQQAKMLMERLGDNALFIADRTQTGKPGERHSSPNLTPETLSKWLKLKPEEKSQRVYTLNDQREDIKPMKWLSGEKYEI
ncbi:MAG: hypothetical protein AAB733_02155 [Patescibacteria group bacterium]